MRRSAVRAPAALLYGCILCFQMLFWSPQKKKKKKKSDHLRHFKQVWPFLSDVSHQQGENVFFLLLTTSCITSRDRCAQNPRRLSVSEIFKPAVCYQQPCKYFPLFKWRGIQEVTEVHFGNNSGFNTQLIPVRSVPREMGRFGQKSPLSRSSDAPLTQNCNQMFPRACSESLSQLAVISASTHSPTPLLVFLPPAVRPSRSGARLSFLRSQTDCSGHQERDKFLLTTLYHASALLRRQPIV